MTSGLRYDVTRFVSIFGSLYPVRDPYPAMFFYKARFLLDFLRILGPAERGPVEEALLALADWEIRQQAEDSFVSESRFAGLRMVRAWELTGEPRYLAYALKQIRLRHEEAIYEVGFQDPLGRQVYHLEDAAVSSNPDWNGRYSALPATAFDLYGGQSMMNAPVLMGALRLRPELYEIYQNTDVYSREDNGGASSASVASLPVFYHHRLESTAARISLAKPTGRLLELEVTWSAGDFRGPGGLPMDPAWVVDEQTFSPNLDRSSAYEGVSFSWRRIQVPPTAPEGDYLLTFPAGEHGVLHATNGVHRVLP